MNERPYDLSFTPPNVRIERHPSTSQEKLPHRSLPAVRYLKKNQRLEFNQRHPVHQQQASKQRKVVYPVVCPLRHVFPSLPIPLHFLPYKKSRKLFLSCFAECVSFFSSPLLKCKTVAVLAHGYFLSVDHREKQIQ
jgi:hypothetical protein